MKPEDVEKLLGGYATGTLTEGERQALFRAALDNQRLFDVLAGEQALKDLLDDPLARAELLRALGESRPALFQWIRVWWGRPLPWALAGGLAAAVFAGFLAIHLRQPTVAPEPIMTAVREVAPEPKAGVTPPAATDEVRQARRAPPPKAPPRQPAETRSEEKAVPVAETEAAVTVKAEAPAPGGPPSTERLAKAAPVVSEVAAGEPGLAEADAGKAAFATPLLDYRLERLLPDGSYAAADPSVVFATGDTVRLAVTPNRAGYLRVMLERAQSARGPILSELVRPGVAYPTPEVRLEAPPSEVTFRVTLLPAPPATGLATRAARSAAGGEKADDERKEAELEVTVKYK